MRLSCVIGRHEAGPNRVRNRGMEFGRCDRCGRALVRARKAWREVPRGFRVVWRRADLAEAPSAAQYLFDLPASGRWLAPAEAPVRRPGRLAVAAELVALGARALAWTLAERVRRWARALLAAGPAARPMLSLPAG
jgi:hypothetical protein